MYIETSKIWNLESSWMEINSIEKKWLYKKNKIILENLRDNLVWVVIERLNTDELDPNIISELVRATNDWFWIRLEYEDIYNHIRWSDDTFIIRHWDEIIWFLSTKNLLDYVYLYWTVIKNKYQWMGIQKSINWKLFWDIKKIFFRTQNNNLIKSYRKDNNKILIWNEAYSKLIEDIWDENFDDFFWWQKIENWVFKWAYWWLFWKEWNVDFLNEATYKWFNSNDGDSLLVAIIKNE